MDKKKFIFAEADEDYLYSIIGKFVQEQGEAISIESITSEEYLQNIMNDPVRCDVLVMEEEWYKRYFRRQNIANVFLLTEYPDMKLENEEYEGDAPGIRRVYKYSSVKEIYLEVMSDLKIEYVPSKRVKQTMLYAVHSPVGGSGKTNLTIGLCATLKKYGNRVLYLNMENIQNFNYLLDDRDYLGPGQWNQGVSEGLEHIVRNNEFDYIPPLRQSSVACGVSYNRVVAALEQMRSKFLYDYIVVELPLDLDDARIQIMNMADKVIFVTKQDALSVWKLERFLENIDYSDRTKFVLVCNFFQELRENYTLKSRKLSVSENIPWLEVATELQSITGMMHSGVFDRLAYLLL